MSEFNLKPYPENPRIISEEQLQVLKESIGTFGDLSGIVFNEKDGFLISGHQRLKTLQEEYPNFKIVITNEIGDEKFGYIEPINLAFRSVSWDDDKAIIARLAANRLGGDWDFEKVENELEKLININTDFNVGLTGFDFLQSLDNNDFDANQDLEEEYWEDMPEFVQENQLNYYQSIIVHLHSENDAKYFAEKIGQTITSNTKYIHIPEQEKAVMKDKQYKSVHNNIDTDTSGEEK